MKVWIAMENFQQTDKECAWKEVKEYEEKKWTILR